MFLLVFFRRFGRRLRAESAALNPEGRKSRMIIPVFYEL
jgi:hypothetical protein